MTRFLTCLGLLACLTGCSSFISNTALCGKYLYRLGTSGIGTRTEVKLLVDEPVSCDSSPTCERRKLYDREDDGGSILDQSFWVTASWKF